MDVDPVVGGHYRLIMETPGYSARNEGVFLVVEAGKRIRYTWEWNRDGEVTEIDVTFSACDTGTRIDLVHSGFLSEDTSNAHSTGWDSYVEGLTEFLAQE